MRKWIKARLKEKSTWKGISLIAGMFGVIVAPDQLELIGATIVGVYGAIETFRNENSKP
tara:strand:+ start:30019 stop:30195 length:177 start_codon:yes stop_codon:yes gene_type:complete